MRRLREPLSRVFPVESARRLHFPVMLTFVAFNVVLVLSMGALRNLNHTFALRPLAMASIGRVFGEATSR